MENQKPIQIIVSKLAIVILTLVTFIRKLALRTPNHDHRKIIENDKKVITQLI